MPDPAPTGREHDPLGVPRPGRTVTGPVTEIVPTGVLVRVGPAPHGPEGLLRDDELAGRAVRVGDTLTVRIVRVDAARPRIDLALAADSRTAREGTDAELAVTAALAGAAVVRGMYGAPLARFEKTAGDFATAADLEAEKVILDLVRAARPQDAVTGEESGSTGPGGASGTERMWLVDPLCGTLNYAARNTLVAVNVALRAGADLTVAASADPFSGEVFWTDGERAHVRRDDGVDEELTPSPASRLVDVNLDPPFPNAPGFAAARLLADARFAERFQTRVLSTTLALAWVAAGRRAAYVTDGDPRDNVHFAAGIALCQAAGCVVTGLHGEPPHTGAGGLVAAADRETHTALLRMIGDPLPPGR
ncbi:inositol monophosphatase family protein [Streptosporangium sp. V21-05]|uniref:inositol monophosphatase family protein n=1 Tax=Streptosporangium sp. V21-05 TaxID=3446115 RepID=UPI003F52DA0E